MNMNRTSYNLHRIENNCIIAITQIHVFFKYLLSVSTTFMYVKPLSNNAKVWKVLLKSIWSSTECYLGETQQHSSSGVSDHRQFSVKWCQRSMQNWIHIYISFAYPKRQNIGRRLTMTNILGQRQTLHFLNIHTVVLGELLKGFIYIMYREPTGITEKTFLHLCF